MDELLKGVFMRSLIIVFAIMFAGCANSGMSRSTYEEKTKQVALGMSKADFLKVFPDATTRGSKMSTSGAVEIMEVDVSMYSFIPTGSSKRNILTGTDSDPHWFQFQDGKLAQFGRAGDWGPDRIIEIRNR